jgi:hypothetical protein
MTTRDPREVKYPSLDRTEWVLLDRAPLTASGANEIVLTAVFKHNVEAAAKAIVGPKWRRQYVAVRKTDIKRFILKCNGCPATYTTDSMGLAAASRHDDIAGKKGPASQCVKWDDYECGGWTLDVSPFLHVPEVMEK